MRLNTVILCSTLHELLLMLLHSHSCGLQAAQTEL